MEPVTITASDKEVTYAASSVKTAPTAKTLAYNGQLQQLIKAGEADGGEMKYLDKYEHSAALYRKLGRKM